MASSNSRSCVVCGKNKRTLRELRFHFFPKDRKRCADWLNKLNIASLKCKTFHQLNTSHVVCSNHFSEIHKTRNGRLVSTATPIPLPGNAAMAISHGNPLKKARVIEKESDFEDSDTKVELGNEDYEMESEDGEGMEDFKIEWKEEELEYNNLNEDLGEKPNKDDAKDKVHDNLSSVIKKEEKILVDYSVCKDDFRSKSEKPNEDDAKDIIQEEISSVVIKKEEEISVDYSIFEDEFKNKAVADQAVVSVKSTVKTTRVIEDTNDESEMDSDDADDNDDFGDGESDKDDDSDKNNISDKNKDEDTSDESEMDSDDADENDDDFGDDESDKDDSDKNNKSDKNYKSDRNKDKEGGNRGLANVMAKILGTKKSDNVILSKAKKDKKYINEAEDLSEDGFEVVDDSGKVKKEPKIKEEKEDKLVTQSAHERELQKKLWERRFRVKPDIKDDREKERRLRVLATQGVVQLFSAIEKHKSMVQKKVSETRSVMEREKVLETTGKEAFLEVLRQKGKKIKVSQEEESVKEEIKDEPLEIPAKKKPRWSVLADNFYKEPTLQSWDQQSDDED